MNIYIFDFLLREFTADTLHAAPFVNQSSIGNSFSSWADEVLRLLLLPLILLQNKIISQTKPHLSLFLTLYRQDTRRQNFNARSSRNILIKELREKEVIAR